MKGHALRREREDLDIDGERIPGASTKSRWSCECGATFGQRSVHNARKVWREHKDGVLPDPTAITSADLKTMVMQEDDDA